MKKYIPYIFLGVIAAFFIYILRPALSHTLNGTFNTVTVPSEYESLEKLLSNDNVFGRTLWVPQTQRFAYYTPDHPTVSANIMYATDSAEITKKLTNSNAESFLKENSIGYVIVPYDSQEEIFLTDRKYDDKKYRQALNDLREVEYLDEIREFKKIGVFKVNKTQPQFSSSNSNSGVEVQRINPSSYILNITNATTNDVIIFTDTFDSNWHAKTESSESRIQSVRSEKYNQNTFKPSQTGNYKLYVKYAPQQIVNTSSILSLLTLVCIVVILITIWIKNRKK